MSARPLVVAIGALHAASEEGIVADAAVIAELDGRCACVATALCPEPDAVPIALSHRLIEAQLAGALAEVPRATRVGYLGSGRDAEAVAQALAARASERIVLAPELPAAQRTALLPLADVVVVRAAGDARDLDAMREAASRLRGQGARAVLVTGGVSGARILDLLDDGGRLTVLDASRIHAQRLPGLAGAHASALTGHLAREEPLATAAEAAQRYVALRLGRGR